MFYCKYAYLNSLGPPGSASTEDERRKKMVYDTGFACANLLETGIRPRDILSFEAFENAITVLNAVADQLTAYSIYWH